MLCLLLLVLNIFFAASVIEESEEVDFSGESDIIDNLTEHSIGQTIPQEFVNEQNSFFLSDDLVPYLTESVKCGHRQFYADGRFEVVVIGSLDPPITLVMATELRSRPLVNRFMHDWCTTEDESIKAMLNHSTLVFFISDKQHAAEFKSTCSEFKDLSFAEDLLLDLYNVISFNMVLMFSSGGIKLRFLQPRRGFAEGLTRVYQQYHPFMGLHDTEICTSPRGVEQSNEAGESQLVREVGWSENRTDEMPFKYLSVVLVQSSCCYEEINFEHQYLENRQSIIEMMKHRTSGFSLTSPRDVLVVTSVSNVYLVKANVSSFIQLPWTRADVKIVDPNVFEVLTEFEVELNNTYTYERRTLV